MQKARSCRGLGHAEGLVMPSAARHPACRAIRDSCHPERSEGSAQRGIRPAGPSGILVILSAAKDLHSEGSGWPGHRCSWACVARRILRVAQDDTGRGFVMPKARSCRRPGHAKGSVIPKVLSCRAQRSTRPAAPSRIFVILSAAKDLHSEASGWPGRRGRWACVARQILRVAQDDTGRGFVMPKAWSCGRPGHAEGSVMRKAWSCRAQRGIRPAAPSGILVILSAAKDLRSEASGLPGHPGFLSS